MLYKKICGIAAGLLLICGIAPAQVGKFYFGIMPTTIKFSTTDPIIDVVVDDNGKPQPFVTIAEGFSLDAAPFRFGKQITEYIAAEFRIAFLDLGKEKTEMTHTYQGDSNASFYSGIQVPDDYGGTVDYYDAELDFLYGGYLRFGSAVNEKFLPYAIVGFTKMQVSGGDSDKWLVDNIFDRGVKVSDSGLSYGVGGSVKLDDGWAIDFEYMQYLKELQDINEVTGIGIGVVKRF